MASNYSSVISGKDKKSTSVSTICDSHSSRQEHMKQFFQERQMDNNESKQTTPASCVKAQSSTNPPPNSSGQVKKVQNMMTELELMWPSPPSLTFNFLYGMTFTPCVKSHVILCHLPLQFKDNVSWLAYLNGWILPVPDIHINSQCATAGLINHCHMCTSWIVNAASIYLFGRKSMITSLHLLNEAVYNVYLTPNHICSHTKYSDCRWTCILPNIIRNGIYRMICCAWKRLKNK